MLKPPNIEAESSTKLHVSRKMVFEEGSFHVHVCWGESSWLLVSKYLHWLGRKSPSSIISCIQTPVQFQLDSPVLVYNRPINVQYIDHIPTNPMKQTYLSRSRLLVYRLLSH